MADIIPINYSLNIATLNKFNYCKKKKLRKEFLLNYPVNLNPDAFESKGETLENDQDE